MTRQYSRIGQTDSGRGSYARKEAWNLLESLLEIY